VTELAPRAVSALGFVAWMAVAWALSEDRRAAPWRTVVWGIALQLGLGLLLLKTPVGSGFFSLMSGLVAALIACTDAGVRFVFGALVDTGFSFAVNVLPTIVFMSSLFAVLYHVGFLQLIVRALSASFRARDADLGRREPLRDRERIPRHGRVGAGRAALSRAHDALGAVLDDDARHGDGRGLGAARLRRHARRRRLRRSPRHREPDRRARGRGDGEADGARARAARDRRRRGRRRSRPRGEPDRRRGAGAIAGLRLAGYVGALLVAFVALIALANGVLGWLGGVIGVPDLTLQRVLGALLAPAAWLLGVPWSDAGHVGALIGLKTVLNEFLAYQALAAQIGAGALGARSAVIASYALCGFANFGSLAIMIGGIGGLAPERRGEVVQLGLRSIVSGTLASFSTACVAGMLL
jgi:CNT family concentrative nucleoside transporter